MRKVFTRALAASAALTLCGTTTFAQSLDLLVNPDTGTVTLHNESFSSAPTIDGYSIDSAAGSLSSAGFVGFAAHALPGWQTVSNSPMDISELNLNSSSTLRIGASYSLGNAFATGHAADLKFNYAIPTSTTVNTGSVVYTNVMQLRIITLLKNGGASVQGTAAVILNGASTSLAINGYAMFSTSGSLNPSLLQGFTANNVSGWVISDSISTKISEFNSSNSTVLAPNHDQALGAVFTSGNAQDLTFTYKVAVPGGSMGAPVIYTSQLAGDANSDGTVNGLDIALISSNWLSAGTLAGDVNYDGVVNGLDIAMISSNWLHTLSTAGIGSGSSAPAAAVPEPAAATLALLSMLALAVYRLTIKPFTA